MAAATPSSSVMRIQAVSSDIGASLWVVAMCSALLEAERLAAESNEIVLSLLCDSLITISILQAAAYDVGG
ncbi:hypothetical protein F4811DRAFT_551569 [Daldinia bambusicola]|nr:hypothetical protein F4811DRAFT_551569 [Daldinia bambusicola]